ncbi:MULTISPECIES: SH3 domain-containing protein [Anaerococcus]|uniref:SH3 domain-containing protein n=1 Tax=Anaerococcus TaxID=165779 RepID=UPI000305953A|nr:MULTISPECIES: SH3 domain-containing protein [Anaerococcus]
MNKRLKSLAVFLLILMTTACAEDKYVSVRHPEDSNVSEVSDSDLEENNTDSESADENTDENNTEEASENTDENTDENSEESSDGVIYTVEDVVNVRLAPSENSAIITQAEPGQDIIKLGDSDNWTRVSISGQTGYIRSDLIKEK